MPMEGGLGKFEPHYFLTMGVQNNLVKKSHLAQKTYGITFGTRLYLHPITKTKLTLILTLTLIPTLTLPTRLTLTVSVKHRNSPLFDEQAHNPDNAILANTLHQ